MGKLADHHIEELQLAAREEYTTHNEDPSLFRKTEGTHRVGEVTVDFEDLVRTFGMPRRIDNTFDGTYYQWDIEFGDGSIATVYDYNMKAPCYDDMEWHIGGKSHDVALLVVLAIIRGAFPTLKQLNS